MAAAIVSLEIEHTLLKQAVVEEVSMAIFNPEGLPPITMTSNVFIKEQLVHPRPKKTEGTSKNE